MLPDAKWKPCYIISHAEDSYDVMLVMEGTSVFGIPARFIRPITTLAAASPMAQSPVPSSTDPPSPRSSDRNSMIASPDASLRSDMESKMDKLTEFLDCVICQKLLYKPVTLPCGHNFWFVAF